MIAVKKINGILISIETFENLFQKDKKMLSDQEIENAKKTAKIDVEVANFEHNDCIRIAYAWLDAQAKTKVPSKTSHLFKHLMETWAGRYVSRSDVIVAAHMHPEIKGEYPYFNISARLTLPAKARLDGIGEAFTQSQHKRFDPSEYKNQE